MIDYQNLRWPPYVLDRLFDSFSNESLSDVDDGNNDDVGELYIGIQLCSTTAKNLKSWFSILDCLLP